MNTFPRLCSSLGTAPQRGVTFGMRKIQPNPEPYFFPADANIVLRDQPDEEEDDEDEDDGADEEDDDEGNDGGYSE